MMRSCPGLRTWRASKSCIFLFYTFMSVWIKHAILQALVFGVSFADGAGAIQSLARDL